MTQGSEEISKKDLLELTGISYGQLYRWKRKGLIPEAWFVKKAAFTGQETFFPRIEILERVGRIQGLKEDLPLDQLADLLSPRPASLPFTLVELREKNIVSTTALELMVATLGSEDPPGFDRILAAWVTDGLLKAGTISLEEGALILRTLAGACAPPDQGELAPPGQGDLLFLRKRGVGFCLVVQGHAFPDPEARLVTTLALPAQVAALKLAIKGDQA